MCISRFHQRDRVRRNSINYAYVSAIFNDRYFRNPANQRQLSRSRETSSLWSAMKNALAPRAGANRIANTAQFDFTGGRKTSSRSIRSIRSAYQREEWKEEEEEEEDAAVWRFSVRLQLLLDRWQPPARPPACPSSTTRAILYAAASTTKNRSTEIAKRARSRRCIGIPRGELLLSRSRKRANAIEGESKRRD